jgi:hypothetical protein
MQTRRTTPHRNQSEIAFSHGLQGQALLRGPHICQIYTSPEERMDTVFDFLQAALASGEQTFCISERSTDDIMDEYLGGLGVSMDAASQAGRFHPDSNSDFYLQKGVFDPTRMMDRWSRLLREARSAGSTAPWAIGDMLPELGYLQGGTQLVIYESKLEELMQFHRATVVCQYDARAFDACTLMGVLRSHPLVLANGKVSESPFYIGPDQKLSH